MLQEPGEIDEREYGRFEVINKSVYNGYQKIMGHYKMHGYAFRPLFSRVKR